jgi:MYXO-CTERM domain-containing protein
MPGSVGLGFSDDGSSFGATQLRTLAPTERVLADDTDGIFEVLTSADSGRYVQLTLNQGPENRWLALGEVTFDGTPGGLPHSTTPEPGSLALALGALAGLIGSGARRRQRAA